jgi:ribosomal protein L11 methyltransferase
LRVLEQFPGARTSEVAEGWEDRWREFHRPVRIGPLWVGPPWEQPPGDAVAVVVDPGRAFGTGAHPTTRLCLELLLDQPAGSVLDIGCGSGVLAIAAAKLGHAPVTAIDADMSAVSATRANAAANRVALDALQLDALTDALPGAELALANIALAAVETLGERLTSARVVTSGYVAADRPKLAGFTLAERRELDGWAADLHESR